MLVAAFVVRDAALEPQLPAAEPLAPQTGLRCFRQGGDHDYCLCLDRLESARSIAGSTASTLPPLDHPTIRYALRHPALYPIINADTLRCVKPPVPTVPRGSGNQQAALPAARQWG